MSEIGGPAYADSVNVGMTDLVASLRWVRDNIANFGGDPDSVMIYGQSGGGSKVTMPDGHALGGGTVPSRLGAVGRRRQSSRRRAVPGAVARQIMKELGLAPNDIALAAEDGMGQTERGRQCRRRQRSTRPCAAHARAWARRRAPRRASAWDRPSMAAS